MVLLLFLLVSVQEGGSDQGVHLCVVSISCVECSFSSYSGAEVETSSPTLLAQPWDGIGSPTASNVVHVKALM